MSLFGCFVHTEAAIVYLTHLGVNNRSRCLVVDPCTYSTDDHLVANGDVPPTLRFSMLHFLPAAVHSFYFVRSSVHKLHRPVSCQLATVLVPRSPHFKRHFRFHSIACNSYEMYLVSFLLFYRL